MYSRLLSPSCSLCHGSADVIDQARGDVRQIQVDQRLLHVLLAPILVLSERTPELRHLHAQLADLESRIVLITTRYAVLLPEHS